MEQTTPQSPIAMLEATADTTAAAEEETSVFVPHEDFDVTVV
jgi:hypothetical protein